MGSLMQAQPQTLLRELNALGVVLSAEGGRLRVKAPPGALTDQLKAEVAEQKAAIISCLEMERPSSDHWQQLADSSLTDMDAISLNDAMFLFAYRMIQNVAPSELVGIWKRYSPYWKKRQSREAFHLIERLYESRLVSGHRAGE